MQNQTQRAGITYESAKNYAHMPEIDTHELIHRANALRERFKQNNVFTCAIINAKSGYCSQDCAFCAQSVHHNTETKTYPLFRTEKIVEQALAMTDSGATHFSIVTSGFMLNSQEMDTICQAIEQISRQTPLTLCTSLGLLTASMANQLKQAGVTNYHHNLETAKSYFGQICSTHNYDDDIETLHIARSAGLRICCGGIMGLGENWDHRIELAFLLKELDVDTIPINFLNPIPGTRLENQPLLSSGTALKCIALFRLIHPEKDIVICGGREVTLQEDQHRLFSAGANGLMIGNYLTTPGQKITSDLEMIRQSGLLIKA